MNKIRKSIRRVFWLYALMFTCLIFALVYILAEPQQIASSYNPRIRTGDPMVIRGQIKDRNGNILAQTVKTDNGFIREYPYNNEFAHIVGYSDVGKMGIELRYNFELEKVRFEILERIKQIIYKTDLNANNLVLTLDEDIQKKSYELLGNRKGTIISIEPSTGKIISMVSYPNFNPNTIKADWESLNNDTENSPLLNRATQGSYPPGSVFKIVTAAAVIENNEDWQNYQNECLGEIDFSDKKIRCFNSKKHGIVDLKSAFAVSCNTTFALLGKSLGANNLKKISERVGFNTSIYYPMDYKGSTFSLNMKSSESELVQTAIGQGKTLTTPLEMLRIVSAIANDGMLMKPYLVDYIEDSKGNTVKKYMPSKEKQLFSNSVANTISDMMVEVVNSGTAITVQIDNIKVAGKTGTAEVDNEIPHSWFVGFAPYESPKAAVVVILENSGEGGLKATPIARDVLKAILDKFK